MITIILLAVGGAVLAAVIGTVWYMPFTPMGRLHMHYLGFDKLSKEEQEKKIKEAKPHMWKMYLGQMILSFLTAFAVISITIISITRGVPTHYALGFVAVNWLCFMVPVVGSAILWSNIDRKIVWKKFFSDIGANFVTVIVIAYIASLLA